MASALTRPEPAMLRRVASVGMAGILLVVGGCTSDPNTNSAQGSEPTDTPREVVVAVEAHRTAIEAGREAMDAALEAGAVGIAVSVMGVAGTLWEEGAGWSDLGARDPIHPERTRFRVYSVAKPMTVVAALRLMGAGRFDPNAPVQTYVPSFPDKGTPITSMQLATHRGGIRHYRDESEAASVVHCSTVSDALPIFAADPLVSPPGRAQSYSSWGFVLLSAALQSAAGLPFDDLMRREVFDVAGMRHTALDDPTRLMPGRSGFYRLDSNGRPLPEKPVDNTCKWGAGGYVATVGDLTRFGQTLIDGTLVSEQALQLFLRGSSEYRVGGSGVGGSAVLIVDVEAGLSLAASTNTAGVQLVRMLEDVLERFRSGFAG